VLVLVLVLVDGAAMPALRQTRWATLARATGTRSRTARTGAAALALHAPPRRALSGQTDKDGAKRAAAPAATSKASASEVEEETSSGEANAAGLTASDVLFFLVVTAGSTGFLLTQLR